MVESTTEESLIEQKQDQGGNFEQQLAKMKETTIAIQQSVGKTSPESIQTALQPYVKPETNPINQFHKKNDEIVKLNAPKTEENETGRKLALLLKDECTIWSVKINLMSRALTELKGSIQVIKLKLVAVKNRYLHLKKLGKFVAKDDFKTQFDDLTVAMEKFKKHIQVIEQIDNDIKQCSNEFEEGENANESKTQQKMKKTKKDLIQAMQTIQTAIQGSQDLEKAKKSKAEFDKSLEEAHEKVEAIYQAEQKHIAQQNKHEVLVAQLAVKNEVYQTEIQKVKLEQKQAIEKLNTIEQQLADAETGKIKNDSTDRENDIEALQKRWKQKRQILQDQMNAFSSQCVLWKAQGSGSIKPMTRTLFTFVCDTSSSMSMDDYNCMIDGCKNLVEQQKDSNDRYAVIIFESDAKVVTYPTPCGSGWKEFERSYGGTDFNEAITETIKLLKTSNEKNQCVVFLTDGCGDGAIDAENQLTESSFQTFKNNCTSFRWFSIEFGSSADRSFLDTITRVANDGKLKEDIDNSTIDYVLTANVQTVRDVYHTIHSSVCQAAAYAAKAVEQCKETIEDFEEQEAIERDRIIQFYKDKTKRQNQGQTELLTWCKDKKEQQKKVVDDLQQQYEDLRNKHAAVDMQQRQSNEAIFECVKKIKELGTQKQENINQEQKLKEDSKNLQQKIIQRQAEQVERCLEEAELQPVIEQNLKYVSVSHAILKNERDVERFIQEIRMQADSVNEALASASFYISQEGFFDMKKLPSICLQYVLELLDIPHDYEKVNIEQDRLVKEMIDVQFSKNATKSSPELNEWAVEFLKTEFDFTAFIFKKLKKELPDDIEYDFAAARGEKHKKERLKKDYVKLAEDQLEPDAYEEHKDLLDIKKQEVKELKKEVRKLQAAFNKIQTKHERKLKQKAKKKKGSDDDDSSVSEMSDDDKEEREEKIIELEELEKEIAEMTSQSEKLKEASKKNTKIFKHFTLQFDAFEDALEEMTTKIVIEESLRGIKENLKLFTEQTLDNLEIMEDIIPKIMTAF